MNPRCRQKHTKPFDVDFIWMDGRLMVPDWQLAKVCGCATDILNNRLRQAEKKKVGQTVKHYEMPSEEAGNLASRNLGKEKQHGGRRNKVLLYNSEMMKLVVAKRHNAVTDKRVFTRILEFCELFKLPNEVEGLGRLWNTHQNSNSRFNVYKASSIESVRENPSPLLNEDNLCWLSAGVVAKSFPISYAISIDRLTLIFKTDLPATRSEELAQTMKEHLASHEGIQLDDIAHTDHGQRIVFKTKNPFSQVLPNRRTGCLDLRIDFNPSKVSLEYAFLPLVSFFAAVESLQHRVLAFHVSRLDIAVDYPCLVLLPLLFDDSARPKHLKKEPTFSAHGQHRTRHDGSLSSDLSYATYDKTFEQQQVSKTGRKPKAMDHLMSAYESNDVMRCEARLRHSKARGAMRVNPFGRFPFPRLLVIREGRRFALPHPGWLCKKYLPQVMERFEPILFKGVEAASMGESRCSGSIEGMVALESKAVYIEESSCIPRRNAERGVRTARRRAGQ